MPSYHIFLNKCASALMVIYKCNLPIDFPAGLDLPNPSGREDILVSLGILSSLPVLERLKEAGL